MSMFQLQGFYIRDVINKKISLPDRNLMIKCYQIESEEESKLVTYEDMIRFQVNYIIYRLHIYMDMYYAVLYYIG